MLSLVRTLQSNISTILLFKTTLNMLGFKKLENSKAPENGNPLILQAETFMRNSCTLETFIKKKKTNSCVLFFS